MKVDWYSEIELNDGRRGCVIEIFPSPDGNEKHKGYMIELSSEPDVSDTVTVEISDIRKVFN